MFDSSTLRGSPYFLKLNRIADYRVNLKIEAFNPAGSIKLTTAESLIRDAERNGKISKNSIVIESSSGNLGVALASVCSRRGYRFTCVIDPNTTKNNISMMRAIGAEIIEVTERDSSGGYLGTRIDYVKQYLNDNANAYWTNQYANPANPTAHDEETAREILERFPEIDLLAIGAGTTGTLMGCIAHFRRNKPSTRILAVDSVGSLNFGVSGKRYIPGLGTSRLPEIFDAKNVSDFVLIPELDTIRTCRMIARKEGYLAGGSTGTVVAGLKARKDLTEASSCIVALSPDGGEKYLDTIYNDDWVKEKFNETL